MEEEREGSYLHPRRLVYKSSPERRKRGNKKQKNKPIKDAATVNTCSQTQKEFIEMQETDKVSNNRDQKTFIESRDKRVKETD